MFAQLRPLLATAPVLDYPAQKHAFIFDADTSNVGLEAVLSQSGEQGKRVAFLAMRVLLQKEITVSHAEWTQADYASISHLSPKLKSLHSQWARLVIRNGLLYCSWGHPSGRGDLLQLLKLL